MQCRVLVGPGTLQRIHRSFLRFNTHPRERVRFQCKELRDSKQLKNAHGTQGGQINRSQTLTLKNGKWPCQSEGPISRKWPFRGSFADCFGAVSVCFTRKRPCTANKIAFPRKCNYWHCNCKPFQWNTVRNGPKKHSYHRVSEPPRRS
jgi:hypothetical protein